MLQLACPWCGPRNEVEFSYGGEAHLVAPGARGSSDAEWAGYLYMRKNPKGLHRERWVHTHGCRRWFNVVRDTTTERILAVYEPGSPPPEVRDEPA
jgi:sarcosine oxidase subunit alpha/sarcosine oxidase subunit delta